jgi:hypothetical protein
MGKGRRCGETEREEESSRSNGKERAQAVEGANGKCRGCGEWKGEEEML